LASPESDELDCVNVIGIFDFGGELSASPIPLGFEGVIVERKPDSDIITVALSPEEALTVTWVQDNDIPLRLDSCAN
ncbi:MAG TPA: hypothetical protein VJZ27_04140, partial [Aggregatilineales bacterium]|nr:hypothetical protein [Aggregatilineales bacterium]